jgi:uncharacterized LabA/DUF88 family protein
VKKVALLIDGGHLRALARQDRLSFTPDFIERFAHQCIEESEELLRVLYYDCPPFAGTVRLPVSGKPTEFKGSREWLDDLAARDFFAVRLGILKFRGFTPRRIPLSDEALKDEDFRPEFEQKGVDMRIGLDIATFAAARSVDRILLVSGDTDCVPALKHARIAGLQVVLIDLPNQKTAAELTWHVDMRRPVKWPA